MEATRPYPFSASAVSRNGAPGLSQNVASVIRSHGNNAVSGNAGSETFGLITPVGLM
jgi:hypothetical protein